MKCLVVVAGLRRCLAINYDPPGLKANSRQQRIAPCHRVLAVAIDVDLHGREGTGKLARQYSGLGDSVSLAK